MEALKLLVLFQTLHALLGNPIAKSVAQLDGLMEEDLSWRLPKSVYPKSYEVEIVLGMDEVGNRDYSGTVMIECDVKEETNQVILHSKGLDVTSVAGFPVEVLGYQLDETRDFLIIDIANTPSDTQMFLLIDFKGQLMLEGVGFYRSEYKIDGVTRYLASTQFEANYARHAFPVFDGKINQKRFKVVAWVERAEDVGVQVMCRLKLFEKKFYYAAWHCDY